MLIIDPLRLHDEIKKNSKKILKILKKCEKNLNKIWKKFEKITKKIEKIKLHVINFFQIELSGIEFNLILQKMS